MMSNEFQSPQTNVLGGPLQPCCFTPLTGYFRDGYCHTDATDLGQHTVCVVVNANFLSYSKTQGNDLSTPHPEYNFPGLNAGDKWCLCALRWKEAWADGMAPPVILEACNATVLDVIPLDVLQQFAWQPENTPKASSTSTH